MERPRTANPKLANLSAHTLRETSLGASPVPSPSPGNRDGSVLWSQDTVPQEALARPHTSNPRYTQLTQKHDLPSAESTPLATARRGQESPSHWESAHSAVLWASEGRGIDPALLERPPTSNPWMARFVEGSQHMEEDGAPAHTQRGGEILWSDEAIEDWRMLARPRASNPTYERHLSVSPTPDEVVPHRLPPCSDELPTTVTDLQDLVLRQRRHIAALDHELHVARSQLAVFRADASQPEMPRVEETETSAGVVTTWNLDSGSETPRGPDAMTSEEPAVLGSSPTEEPPLEPLPPTAMRPGDGQRTVPLRPTPLRSDGEIALDDAEGSDAEATTAREQRVLQEHHHTSHFVARFPRRPESATLARHFHGHVQASPPAKRPLSAPARPAPMHAFAQADVLAAAALPTSMTEDAVNTAYDELRGAGPHVAKSVFRQAYRARAAEYGVVVSDADLDRLLGGFDAAGPEALSRDEFAVLYLRMAGW